MLLAVVVDAFLLRSDFHFKLIFAHSTMSLAMMCVLQRLFLLPPIVVVLSARTNCNRTNRNNQQRIYVCRHHRRFVPLIRTFSLAWQLYIPFFSLFLSCSAVFCFVLCRAHGCASHPQYSANGAYTQAYY